jgi:hypothetical protein
MAHHVCHSYPFARRFRPKWLTGYANRFVLEAKMAHHVCHSYPSPRRSRPKWYTRCANHLVLEAGMAHHMRHHSPSPRGVAHHGPNSLFSGLRNRLRQIMLRQLRRLAGDPLSPCLIGSPTTRVDVSLKSEGIIVRERHLVVVSCSNQITQRAGQPGLLRKPMMIAASDPPS